MTTSLARTSLGVGLRPSHFEDLERTQEDTPDYLEIIVENFLDTSSVPRARLRKLATRYPVVGHGVALNLFGTDPLNMDYLHALKDLVQEFSMPYTSDHMCWTASEGVQHHDLLPVPYDPSIVPYAAERAAFVQDFLGVPLGIENLSSYLTWSRDKVSEWTFYTEFVRASGCWFMLDLNNIFVSARNHSFNPLDYLDAISWDRVLQVHLAGHQVLPNGIHHDTHDRPVVQEVWDLYQNAWQRGGPFPTLLEWDAQIPPLKDVVKELHKAREARKT